MLCTKENISLRILSLSPPWVCVCGLRRFSDRPDRASNNKASFGGSQLVWPHMDWVGCQSWFGSSWVLRAMSTTGHFLLENRARMVKLWGSRNTHQKKYVKPRASGFSPTKMWIFHLWLSYFFSYYLCYKKGTFSVQGLPTATLVWHKSASSAFSFACDLQLKPKYPCLGREASRNDAIIFPPHNFA